MSALAPVLQGFFTDKLARQRQASPHTIAAYRDTCKLLLEFAATRARKQPCQLDIADLDAPLVTAFLQHLETGRVNAVTTRNARLAAIHSLFRYAAVHAPEHAAQISRVLAIPPKRCDRAIVCFLTAKEIDALLAAPGQATWLGRRDHALLLLAVQTGLRVSELTSLTCGDVHLGTGAHVRCHGKGRKDRATPLTRQTASILRAWLAERGGCPATRCSLPGQGTPCPAMLSNASSPSTQPQQQPPARPSPARTSPRTHSGTQPRWPCCTQAWTPPSSRSGWGMRTPHPHRPTCTPT
jgi:integrase/recombinase XerD